MTPHAAQQSLPSALARDAAPSARTSARTHLPTHYVDSVRGLAATYVMLGHARFLLLIGTVAALQHGGAVKYEAIGLLVTRYGVGAVMAFFLVSGYAIHYRQAFALAQGNLEMRWRDYAWHRFRRLYPPLLAAVGITALADTVGTHLYAPIYLGTSPVLNFGGNESLTVGSLLSTLTFTQGFIARVFGTDVPLWSLAYEAFFYLAYPLALAVNRRAGPVKTLFAFCVLGGGVALVNGLGLNWHPLDLLALWPAWIGGMFIADARAGRVRLPQRFWSICAVASLILLAGTSLGLLLLRSQQTQNNPALTGVNFTFLLWILSFAGPLGWLCAAEHTAQTRARVSKICRPLLGLGAMSYSLYVVHFPVLALVSAWWISRTGALPTSPWLMVGGICAALAAGFIVYLVAERPVTGGGAKRRKHEDATRDDAPRSSVVAASQPANTTGGDAEEPILREVRAQSERWMSRRWNMPSQAQSLRELGSPEWDFVTRALGYTPDRAWIVTVQVNGPANGQANGMQDTAVIAQYQGQIFAVEPPRSSPLVAER
jgi:peptidoglycan/LPS O-acetylase OafA/YrhL